MSTMNLVLYGLAAWLLIGAAYSLTNYFRLFKKSWTELEVDANIKLAKFGLICDCWITTSGIALSFILMIFLGKVFYEGFFDVRANDTSVPAMLNEKSRFFFSEYLFAIQFTVFFVFFINIVTTVISAYYWLKRNVKKSGSDLFRKNLNARIAGYCFNVMCSIVMAGVFLAL